MLSSLARGVISAPKRVLGGALLVLIICGVLGSSVAANLSGGGFSDPNSESAQANQVLSDTFARGGLQVVIRVHQDGTADIVDSPTARAAGEAIVRELDEMSFVEDPIVSAWTNPEAAGALVSRDRASGLVVTTVSGGDKEAEENGKKIDDRFTDRSFAAQYPGVDVLVGGQALVYSQVNEQTSHDLFIAEAIAIPISFLLLIWVFGGLIAAVLPLAIGIFAIIGTTAVLRGFTVFADVSVFALNLTTALGLALAIDYTLLIINRYREEVQGGRDRDDALTVTVKTAGRTVLFSAVTVALSLAAMAIFPMYFLRSFAYAGLAVVALAAAAALIIAPAIIALLGPRIDALDVRKPIRKWLGRSEPKVPEPEESMWYRSTRFVLRHAVPVGLSVVVLLLVLGAPFLGIKFGYPDDRVLPTSASTHVLGDELRDDYAQNASATVTIVIPDTRGFDDAALTDYGQALSQVANVTAVGTPVGSFVDGQGAGGPGPNMAEGDAALITVSSTVDPFSDSGRDQLDALRAVSPPGDATALFSGLAQQNVDNVDSIIDHLPEVFAVIVVTTFVLLFLLTGSVVLPLKALVLNVFSLTATFGAMVWIFQDGNLGGLGTTTTGTLIANMPVLMFCIAFGLSMDYEVFLLSRIREEWLKSGRTRADNDHAVAYGLARTGRVVTAAALLMAVVFAGIAFSQVSFMRMFGLGLALAVLMDATLIRMLLVPAFMKIAGRANWWAPAPLRRFHDRFGLSEEGGHDSRSTPKAEVSAGSGEQLRAEILEAATELLLSSGDESAVSIRAVANRVGVTPPSIYIHFADKDALIGEVVAHYFTRLDEVMRQAGAEHDNTWEAAHAQGMAYVRFAVENAELYRVATMKVCAEGTDADAVLSQSAFVHFAETIERLMDEGFVDKGDPTPVVMELWTAAHGVAALMIAKPYVALGENYELADRVLTSVCLGRAIKDVIGGDVGPHEIRTFVLEQRSRAGDRIALPNPE